MCSDGPRAGLINVFTLPMWHCCDNQIPRQACSFPLRGFVCLWGQALSLLYDKDITFPLCMCVCLHKRDRKKESWLHNSKRKSLSCLNPENGISHTHTRTHVSVGHSACQGLITLRVVQLEYYPQCNHKTSQGSPRLRDGPPYYIRSKVNELIMWATASSAAFKNKPQIENNLRLTSKLCFANVNVIFSRH